MDAGEPPTETDSSGKPKFPWPTMALGVVVACIMVLGLLLAVGQRDGPRQSSSDPLAGQQGRQPELPPRDRSDPDAETAKTSGEAAEAGRQAASGSENGRPGLRATLGTIHQRPLACVSGGEVARPADDGSFFGHLPYQDAPAGALVTPPAGFALGNCPQLHRDAANGVRQLREAMARDNPELAARLVGLSCFRSIARQRSVFCSKVDASMAERARPSAPPGFSEHHTGLAVDFGDRKVPGCNLAVCFATTPVGQWLLANARTYGFELSFPAGNSQGVMYEPWHWRYVGGQSAGVFARAREQFGAGGRFAAAATGNAADEAAEDPQPRNAPVVDATSANSEPTRTPEPPGVPLVVTQPSPVAPTTPAPAPTSPGLPAGVTADETGVINEPPS
jgi:zinc D-Ala-D-Ala carboxypeptidase